MATKYPDDVDNTSSLPYVINGTSPMVGDDVNRLRDAIVAVETELGANPSGTFTSVDARLGVAEAAIADYANSTFLVLSADGFISQERVFSPSVNFDVVDGGAGANFEIDLAANIGIGTITPASDHSLTLDGDGATRIGGITLRNTGTDTFYIGSATASDSANISLMNPNSGYIRLGTDNAERVRISAAGDVGVGTNSPSGRLHVSGGNLLVEAGSVGIGTSTPSELLHISGGNLLVEAGSVGIGTSTPSELLHISGGNVLLESTAGAGVPYATMKGTQGGLQMSSGNGIGKLDVLNSTGTVIMSLLNNVDNRLVGANNADFSFYTNNAEKMRITAGGDLLVNSTANPDLARLHISGGGITHSSSQFNARPGAGVNYEWVNRNGAGHTWYVNSAATQAMTLTSAGNFGIGTSLPISQFSVGSSSEFRVDSSGDITRINDVPYTFPAAQGVASSVLKNDGSGSLGWSLLADTEIVGGLQTVADTTARDAIPSARRKEGMLAYSQADDTYYTLVGGTLNSNWTSALQRTNQERYGVVNGCVVGAGVGTGIEIGAGSFYDASGRRITLLAPVSVPVSAPAANGAYAVSWDPDVGAFTTANLTTGQGCGINDLPFAVVVLNGAGSAISLLESVVRIADGQYDRSFVTVSGTAAFNAANFNTLRKAMLHVMCFATTEPAPKEIRVVGNLTEPNTAAEGASIRLTSATGFPWAQPSRFSGLKVVGKSNINAASRPVITWNSLTGPLVDFSTAVKNFGFEGVDFNATGTGSYTDRNRCLFKNVSRGFSCVDSTIDGNSVITHVVYWTDPIVDLGGGADSASQSEGVVFRRVFGQDTVFDEGVPFFFGDNTGTGAAQVATIGGRLTFSECSFNCNPGNPAFYLVSTDTEADTTTSNFDIVVEKTTINQFRRVFNNCDASQKLVTASTLRDVTQGFATTTAATRRGQIIGSTFSGVQVSLSGAGDVIGCTLASSCSLGMDSSNRISGCDFSSGSVGGQFSSIENSTINLGTGGILSIPSVTNSVWPVISNSTILKANVDAGNNKMLDLNTAASACVVTSTRFLYTNSATSTQALIAMTGSAAQLKLHGCTFDVAGQRASMTNVITVTSTGDFRLSLSDCTLDMPLGFLQVLRASGTAGEVTITNCVVATNGPNAIDISTAGTGYLASVRISDSKFTCTATDPIYNIFHAKDLFVTNNVFNHTNGAAAYTFGGITATEGRQDVALIKGNSFKGTSNGRKCDVYGDSYTKFMYDGNSQAVINVTNTATTYLQVGGQAFSRECTVANNQLTCDSNTVSGNVSSALVLVNSFAEIAVTGNSLYSGALGADLSSYMLLTAGRTVTCTGNTLLSTQNVASTVENCYVAISAQCTAAGDGNITVSSNAMEASVGDSGSGLAECVINVNSAFAAVVSGNAIRTRQNGTGAIGHITVGGGGAISYVDVSNNILRSSQDAAVDLLSATTSMTFSGNLLDANAGTAIVDLAQAATTVNATGNTLFSSGNGQLMLGTTATEEAIATGNVLGSNSGGSILSVVSNRMASATGNAVRSGASVVVTVGATSTINGLASNNILEATTNIVLDVDGTVNVSATGNTLRSSGVATMTVGSGAAGTNNAMASNNILEGNNGVSLRALGDAAVNVVGNIGRSASSTVDLRADGITSNYVGCLANNTIRCLSGTATLSCGAGVLDTGLMCSISDNVVRSSGPAVIIMSGTHIFSKFRDNVASGGFNVGAVPGAVLSSGNNVV